MNNEGKNEGKKEKAFHLKKFINIKKIVKKPLTYKILFILLISFSFLRQPIQISHLNRTELKNNFLLLSLIFPWNRQSFFISKGKISFKS